MPLSCFSIECKSCEFGDYWIDSSNLGFLAKVVGYSKLLGTGVRANQDGHHIGPNHRGNKEGNSLNSQNDELVIFEVYPMAI